MYAARVDLLASIETPNGGAVEGLLHERVCLLDACAIVCAADDETQPKPLTG